MSDDKINEFFKKNAHKPKVIVLPSEPRKEEKVEVLTHEQMEALLEAFPAL